MATEYEDRQKQEAEANRKRRELRAAQDKANVDLVKRQREEAAKSNAETVARQTNAKPTPTQEENDLARLGSSVLEKEEDGSPPDPHNLPVGAEVVTRNVAAGDAAGTYKTRHAAAEDHKTKK
jgi:hypothetical protein